MRTLRHKALLLAFSLLYVLSACHSNKPQNLLQTIPQEVDYMGYIDLNRMDDLLSEETLRYHLSPKEMEHLAKLRTHMVGKGAIVYGDSATQYITLFVKNAKRLKEDLAQLTDSISSDNGFEFVLLDSWNLAFNENQLWLSQQNFFTPLFEQSQYLSKSEGLSAQNIKGIKQLFDGDFGLYFNPKRHLEGASWTRALSHELQQNLRNTRFIANASIKEKEIQIAYKLIGEDGEPIEDKQDLTEKVDKDILKYIPDNCDLVLLLGMDGKEVSSLLEQTNQDAQTPDRKLLLGTLDGTVAFAASLNRQSYYTTEEWSIVAQTKKGKEKEAVTLALKLLDVQPQSTKRLGEDFIVNSNRYGDFYVGYRKGILFAASRPINKFTPSFQEHPVSRAIQKGVGNLLINVSPKSTVSQYAREVLNYPFEGYVALRAQSMGEGKVVIHNDLETEVNMLQGILKALRPIPTTEVNPEM
ncbi:MAG: DUF4836 family protein [Porphyromonas sp.]|nr:DUF4836 family protein [Porphyromonas sp.]